MKQQKELLIPTYSLEGLTNYLEITLYTLTW